ncbi:MAG TPA: hypothetical protein VNG90_05715 [Candidatus Acidoferrum sp.]|nr:hypothetical protein [Candidatus Acidoferrum sp.]
MKIETNTNKHDIPLLGILSFFGSGISFLVAIVQLIRVEGPGSPDLSYTLSGAYGQTQFTIMLFIFALAVILCVIGATTLFMKLRDHYPYPAVLSLVSVSIAAALFITVLTFQYTLVALVSEGLGTFNSQFHFFAVLAHSGSDFSGWISILLFALFVFVTSLVLQKRHEWRAVRYSGFLFSAIAVILYILSASYAFLILFGIWEIIVAASLALSYRQH